MAANQYGSYAGKVAFVTGAGSGIGRATALAFAREGASVVASDVSEQDVRDTARMIEELGGDSLAVGCDVTRSGDVKAALDTATAVMEKIPALADGDRDRYVVRNLSRAPLHTPYTTIAPNLVEQAIELDGKASDPQPLAVPLRRPPGPFVGLVLDATGVGRPVVDMARQAMREARKTPAGSRVNLRFKAVNVTGGNTEASDGHGFVNVPKKNLITSAAALVQDGRLEIPKDVEHRDVLLAELRDYRRSVNIATGHAAFEPWRRDQRDDLLFSVCLCTWLFTRPQPVARGMRVVSF